MTLTAVPSGAELVSRAEELVPRLRSHAVWMEENRGLHDDVLGALRESGLLRMRVPLRYGGFESDMRTTVGVISELARGDASVAWTTAVYAISTWMAGLFPDEVQDEIFADPDVRISGILSPTVQAVPVEGGVVLNGRWAFNSGAGHSSWNTCAAVLVDGDRQPQPVMVAVPLADLTVVDDWHTSGLRGSGSVSTVAEDVFVPDTRVLHMGPVLAGRHGSERNSDRPLWRAPFMPTACATVGAPALGMAKAAQEFFTERLPGRKISYTDYESQREAPLTHLQLAEAALRTDEAAFHVFRAADLLDSKAAAGETWTLEERARVRLDLGAVCRRSQEAVDILSSASGGSSVYTDVPIQRIERDMRTMSRHAIIHPNTNLELYGRILAGLNPNTLYI
ncbi:acyl-CoA dehydrogenase [Streptomyces sp. CB02923]|uniref:acyl-CoA dehydrogenase family protein n=1 Tax=Streptomyces sp. CB02923 TaxID=1718985 RepID=UPI0009390DD6|nr:acyl-CoA dehydrogenase family protein [Streptomyces sp. CB02923]OKI01274.1 acyl-CoA dehydrogenase [Streptomyces sp. CB02923]